MDNDLLTKTNEQWKKELPPDVYHVTREQGTEPPFAGKYVFAKDKGVYRCYNCGNELFSSDTKFDSGSGWPSFFEPINNDNVETRSDTSHGMTRTEVVCRRCGAHLGHVFDDGPSDKTGLRYCINSCALNLDKTEN